MRTISHIREEAEAYKSATGRYPDALRVKRGGEAHAELIRLGLGHLAKDSPGLEGQVELRVKQVLAHFDPARLRPRTPWLDRRGL